MGREKRTTVNSYRAHKGKHQIKESNHLGIVYLLHFTHKVHHAQHYIGFTGRQLDCRLGEHWSGNGTGLTSAVHAEAGNELILARTWPPEAAEREVSIDEMVNQSVEMILKCRAESPKLCPICNPRALEYAQYGPPEAKPIEEEIPF
jgi:hypothetical protein